MTLIIYVPFDSGIVLIADRQNSYPRAGVKEPVCKIDKINEGGFVTAGAGSTAAYRTIVSHLERDETVNAKNLAEKVVEKIRLNFKEAKDYMGSTILLDVTIFAVSWENSTILLSRVIGVLANPLDITKCHAIGSGKDFISPQLDIDTNSMTEKEAIDFGLTLIKYASQIDLAVSAPETYGCDYVVIKNDGTIQRELKRLKSVGIESLLYKPHLAKIEFEEAKI